MKRELQKGDVPVLILAVLAEGSCHGYGIARRIEQQSEQALHMREGSLYPALRVLEQEGLVSSVWEEQPTGPARKVYSLTEGGRSELARRKREWEEYVNAMSGTLRRIGHAEPA